VKYEEIYLHAYVSGSEAPASLTKYFPFDNTRRFHENRDRATPDEMYCGALAKTTRLAACADAPPTRSISTDTEVAAPPRSLLLQPYTEPILPLRGEKPNSFSRPSA